MKCPRCELITSNNREDCPRCGFDLRPVKENFNINPIPSADIHEKTKGSFSDLVAIVDQKVKDKLIKAKPDLQKSQSNSIEGLKIPEVTQQAPPLTRQETTPLAKAVTTLASAKAEPKVELRTEPKVEAKPTVVVEQKPVPKVEPKKEITKEIHPVFESADHLQSIINQTEVIKEASKDSSSNLEALAKLTGNINIPKKIVITPEEWKKCELEMVRTSVANTDLGFVEVLDLEQDNEVLLLFELAEREILDPNSRIGEAKAPSKKSKIVSNLDQAVRNFVEADQQTEALKKLNIISNSSVSLIIGDSMIPASNFRRICAFIVDFNVNLILTLAFLWLRFLPVNIKTSIIALDRNILFELLPYIFDLPLYFVIFWIVGQCLSLATIGSTLGAKIFRIGITDQEGFLLTFKHSLLRGLSWSVTFFTFGLGSIMMFFKHRQTLHDRVSKTIVIHLGS